MQGTGGLGDEVSPRWLVTQQTDLLKRDGLKPCMRPISSTGDIWPADRWVVLYCLRQMLDHHECQGW